MPQLLCHGQVMFPQMILLFVEISYEMTMLSFQLSDNYTVVETPTTSLVPATFLTTGSVQCTLTATSPFSAFRVSVSNNKVDQSTYRHYFVVDEGCLSCDIARMACTQKVKFCKDNLQYMPKQIIISLKMCFITIA